MLIKKKKTVKEIVVPVTKATAAHVSSNSGFNFHNPITQEIENQAKSLVQKKSEELLEQFNKEIAVKKSHAEEEIQQMLLQAQNEAASIVEEANAYKKTAEIEIYDTKKLLDNERNQIVILKEQELKQSFEEGMSKASEIISELMNYLMTFHDAKKKVIEESKKEIMSIAFDLVNQIIGYEVEVNDEVLQAQVERAISKVVTAKGIMQIYLNPQDIDKVASLEKALLKVLDPSIKLVFQKDETVDQGSCIVNTQGGRLDASFTGQIKVLKEVLGRYLGYEIKPLKEPVKEAVIEPKNEIEEDFVDLKFDPLDDFDFENLSLEDYLLKHGENVDNNIIESIDLEDETMSILELESQDSKELGANDFSDQDAELILDDDLDDPDEDLDDDFEDDEDEEDDDLEDDEEDLDEEEVEEEDDEDFEDDEDLEEYEENPDDDDDKGDDRFPEY